MNRRHAYIIFGAAFVVRIVYLAVIYTGPDSLLFEDSSMYLKLSAWLLQSVDVNSLGQDGLQRMFVERAPLYILFVAGIQMFVGDSYLHIVGVQIVIDSVVCVLIGSLAGYFHRRLVLIAGLLAAVNINMIIHTSLVLSDSLFMLPFVAALLASASYIRRPSVVTAVVVAALFAVALLVRPVLLYLPLVIMFYFAIVAWHHRVPRVNITVHILLIAVTFCAIVGPIFMKNHQNYKHLSYVSQTGTHALFWIYPQANEFANGVSREDSVSAMVSRLGEYRDTKFVKADPQNPFAMSAEMKTVASAALWELGPYALVKAWAIGSVINVAAPAIVSSSLVRRMERPSFTETPGANPIEKVWNYLSVSKTFTLVLLPAVALTGFLRLIAAFGLLQLWVRNGRVRSESLADPTQTAYLLVIGAYLFAVTGPVVGIKYRLPMEPVLDIFLAVGILWLVEFLRATEKSKK